MGRGQDAACGRAGDGEGMIDLREHEIGQRFRTRGGGEARLCERTPLEIYKVQHADRERVHFEDGRGVYLDAPPKFDLIRPIYSVPAKTRRIPSAKHMYQLGGGV